MAFDITDPFKGSSLKGFGFKRYQEVENFIDKNFNLKLTPDMPQLPKFGGGRAGKRSRDYARIISAIQSRILRSVTSPGRKSTIGTSPRGVINGL